MDWRARAAEELFGPAATPGDHWRTLTAATLGAATAAAMTYATEPGIGPLPLIVVAVVAFDLFGGLWSNAIVAAWAGVRRSRLWRVLFVALHPHAFILAWAMTGYDVVDAAATWLWAAAGSAIVVALPSPQRPAAALWLCALGIGVLTFLSGQATTSWVAAAYLLKLLASFAARPDPTK